MEDDELRRYVARLINNVQRANGYHAREEIERILAPLRQDPKRLEPFGFKVYSQSDEDGILEEIFRRLAIEEGRFVEIGVENGLECNTHYLLHKRWQGLWLEGDTNQRPAIQRVFAPILGKRLSVGFAWISAENINGNFKALGVEEDLDFLSIDIDGNDIWLLDALEVRPKVICIEYNSKFPAHLSKRPVYDPDRRWTGGDFMGSSLMALTESAGAKGYRLVATNIVGSNAFFVREDLAGDGFPDDESPQNLYNPPRYWLWSDHFLHIGHRAEFGAYVDMIDG